MNTFISDHIKTIYDKITNLEKQNIVLLTANNKHAINFHELQLAHNALQKEFLSLKNGTDEVSDPTFEQISLFGPITKTFNIPSNATAMKILMCGGGGAGTASHGGGGGASVFNMIVPLFDHAGQLIVRAGGGGISAEFPDGGSSIVEIITQSGERRVIEAPGGRSKWGGVNCNNSLFNGNDGDLSIGGGTTFSLSTKIGGQSWTGAGGAPVSTGELTHQMGGNGYVNVSFI